MAALTRRPPKDPLDHDPKAVRKARDDSELTQQQVAELCGVTRSLIAEIELGTRNAYPEMIDKLAAALRCPAADLERKREPEAAPSAAVGVPQVRGDERADTADLPELRRVGGQ